MGKSKSIWTTVRVYCEVGRFAMVRQRMEWPDDPEKEAWEGDRLVTQYTPYGKDKQYGKGVTVKAQNDEIQHIKDALNKFSDMLAIERDNAGLGTQSEEGEEELPF